MAKDKNPANTASGTFEQDPERPDLAPGAYELHPMYVVTAGGVGSFKKGDVIQAGDLGSAEDIRRLHQDVGAIAPWGSVEAVAAVKEVTTQTAADAATAAPGDFVQVGVPYIDPQSNTGEAHADPPSVSNPTEQQQANQAAEGPQA